jgi:antirestriction protein
VGDVLQYVTSQYNSRRYRVENNQTLTGEEPRAWFGCLASYNEGRLVGKWFDLEGADGDDIRAMIAAVVTEPGGEWFMADSENLPRLFGENPSPETLAEYVEEVERADLDGIPACVYREVCEDVGQIVDPDSIRIYGGGDVRDASDVALAVCEAIGDLSSMVGDGSPIPEELERYFDWDAYGRDLLLQDFQIIEGYAVQVA